SRFTRGSVLAWAAIAPERLRVIPNTVGSLFSPGDSPLRHEWGRNGKPVLLTVGRLEPKERYKGHDRVIAAIPELVARGHDIIYAIAGEGNDRQRLEDLARNAGILDRVRFLGSVSKE